MSHNQADHVCPPFIGYFLLGNPLRKLLYTPKSIVAPYVSEGMTVIEPGPGMGFFTLELAHRVGPEGRVIALDIQSKMLKVLAQRLQRAGLLGRVDLRLIKNDSLGIKDLKSKAGFFLAFAMVHEVPNPSQFFREAFVSLREGGQLLLVEPRGHVSEELFRQELNYAESAGFRVASGPRICMSRAALLKKERERAQQPARRSGKAGTRKLTRSSGRSPQGRKK